MPNIVHNTIELTFEDENSMHEFSSKVTKNGEDHYQLAYSLYPVPKHVNEYDWTIKTYGGKWGDWYTELETLFRDNKLRFKFDSAWAPLVPLALKINEDYKIHTKLTFISFENWNEGLLEIDKTGKIINDEYRDLDESMFEDE